MTGKSQIYFLAIGLLLTSAIVFIASTHYANAYAVNSTGQPIGGQANANTNTNPGQNYNFDNSFQNLISPFQNFIQNLQSNNINPGGPMIPAGVTVPINVQAGAQNVFIQFDNWFYNLTGIQLSQIGVVILSVLSWILGLAEGIVNWLLNLIR